MRFEQNDPPRAYACGIRDEVTIHDCGRVALEPDEQVTFTTPAGGEYDLARKSWGFYATPSLNARLPRFGLHAVLVRNTKRQWFVMLVEEGREAEFDAYLAAEELVVVARMDTTEALEALEMEAARG
ncbi:MAG: hypothetical protein U0237_05830 [Thermoleophilia bacterium]